MSEDVGWPGEWLRGVLGLCVLRTLADGPTYGYAIASRLAEAGLGHVKGGTLYPLLGRLETAGHVTVEWRQGEGGPGRKYYSLTAAGEQELAAQAERWLTFSALTADLVTGPAAASAAPTPTAPLQAELPSRSTTTTTPEVPR